MSIKKEGYLSSGRSEKGSKFPKSLILEIVESVHNGVTRKEVCKQYGVAYCTIGEWLSKYGGDWYHQDKKVAFPMLKKRQIVRKVLEGQMTRREACLAYKIKGNTLQRWIREIKKQDNDLLQLKPSDMPTKSAPAVPDELQKQLADAELKILALQTMIDIAEKQFNIPIRKKPGAKQ